MNGSIRYHKKKSHFSEMKSPVRVSTSCSGGEFLFIIVFCMWCAKKQKTIRFSVAIIIFWQPFIVSTVQQTAIHKIFTQISKFPLAFFHTLGYDMLALKSKEC